MPRFRSWVWFWAATLLLGIGASSAQESRPSEKPTPEIPAKEKPTVDVPAGEKPSPEIRPCEKLLPQKTVGFVVVSNVEELADRWKKTQLGQLMADPVMEPFAKDLREQVEDQWSGVRDRLGLTVDDLKDVPGGEVALGVILLPAQDDTEDDQASLAVVVDVTGHLEQANAMLEKLWANLKQQGAKRNEIKVPEGTQPVVQFENLPRPEDDPQAEPGKAFYVLSGSLLVASDKLQVIQGILARLPADRGDSLADLPAFQAVMRRCARDIGDAPDARPQIRWFIHPLGYVQVVRAVTPEKLRRRGKSVLDMLRDQGFGAIKGVGGTVNLYVSEEYQLVHRAAVHAPPPYEKSMKMLGFRNGPEFAPQRWVPRDIATYTTFYVDILNAFDNFGPLFDELMGGPPLLFSAGLTHRADLDKGVLPKEFRQEFRQLDISLPSKAEVVAKKPGSLWEIKGKDEIYVVRRSVRYDEIKKKKDVILKVYPKVAGYWEDTLAGLKKDPNGPRIDLREEFIKHLGRRVTMITSYQEPITTASERLLFAIETTNEKAAAAAIAKTMGIGKDVKRHEFEGHVIWEIVEAQKPEQLDVPSITLPPLMLEGGAGPAEETVEEDARLLPHAAVTVAYRHLFVASHVDFLKEVLKPVEERETLNPNLDYKLVNEAVGQLGITEKCARVFSRTDEEYRPTYELIRQGKMPQSETLLGRLLNTIFTTGKQGEFRLQKIDGSKMPEYDVVRRYLGPAGLVVTSERDPATNQPTGWFFKGFTLKKGSP